MERKPSMPVDGVNNHLLGAGLEIGETVMMNGRVVKSIDFALSLRSSGAGTDPQRGLDDSI
jgi:hypothetical protein